MIRAVAYHEGPMTSRKPARIRAFPWRSLEAITRSEVSALRDVKRWVAAHVRIDEFAAVLGGMIGEKIDFRIGVARPLGTEPLVDEGVGLLFAPAQSASTARGALLEAEPALAANLVARALKRPLPSVVKPDVAPSPGVAGALAALVVAAARRAHRGFPLRIVRAGPARALALDFSRDDPDLWAVSLTVLVGDDAFAARVIVSRDAVRTSHVPWWDRSALAGLGVTPIGLPIVACSLLATSTELATLEPGDAMIPMPPGAWPLTRETPAVGPVLLAAPSSDLALSATLGENGTLVLGGKLEPLLAAEANMDSEAKDALVASLGDVPVVVRVEIGEALMAARDWASLGSGDVVALGRRIGDLVLLRVGGVPLARGELVDLDGEVAVRIVERLGESTTP
jgi:flagellar motor switch/type III secretory pathway protein FliN